MLLVFTFIYVEPRRQAQHAGTFDSDQLHAHQIDSSIIRYVLGLTGSFHKALSQERRRLLNELDGHLQQAQELYESVSQRQALMAWLQGFPGKPFKQPRPQIAVSGGDFSQVFLALRKALEPTRTELQQQPLEVQGDI